MSSKYEGGEVLKSKTQSGGKNKVQKLGFVSMVRVKRFSQRMKVFDAGIYNYNFDFGVNAG
jgi:hypothetical protein